MIQPSSRSCSTAAATTSATRSAGTTTAPSPSATMTSFGITATPPQPIGSCQPTKVRPLTDAGAAAPWHQTGSVVARTPARSRTTPSVTSAATPRFAILAHRMSPKIPAELVPIASTTAIAPSGIASIAARVEVGDAHDAGVARSSRAGTKRKRERTADAALGQPLGERPGAADPDVAQPLLEKHGGERRGRDAGERVARRVVERLGRDAVHGRRIACSPLRSSDADVVAR